MDATDFQALTERIEAWNETGEYTTLIPAEAYAVWADNYHETADTLDEFEAWATDAEENYEGDYASDIEFAQGFADAIGVEIPEQWPLSCIDWEQAARDLMYDYFTYRGYYFRNA